MTQARQLPEGADSATRAVFAGGVTSGAIDTIDFVTIATLGNAQDFGNTVGNTYGMGGVAGI